VRALARVLMQRALKEHFGLAPQTQKPDADVLVNRLCERLDDVGRDDLRRGLHRLRVAGNDRLHRHEAGWLLPKGDALRFDESKLETAARKSIEKLHRLFQMLEANAPPAAK